MGLFVTNDLSSSLFSGFMFVLVIFESRHFIMVDFSRSRIIVLGRNRNGSGPICLELAPFLAKESAISFPVIPMCALTLCKEILYVLLKSFRLFIASICIIL